MKKLLSLAAVLAIVATGAVHAGTVTQGHAIAVTDENGQLLSLAFKPGTVKMATTKTTHGKGKGATMFGLDDVLKMGKGFLSNDQFQKIASSVAQKGFEEGAKLLQDPKIVGAVVDAAATAAKAAAPVVGKVAADNSDLVGKGIELGMDNAPKAIDAASNLVR